MNGWFNIFFPFIREYPNRYCVPYDPTNDYVKEGLVWDARYSDEHPESYDHLGGMPGGPDINYFPNGLSEAPVVWSYLGTKIDLMFRSGIERLQFLTPALTLTLSKSNRSS